MFNDVMNGEIDHEPGGAGSRHATTNCKVGSDRGPQNKKRNASIACFM